MKGERAVSFRSGPHDLIGIVSSGSAKSVVGLIIAVGSPQYRVGSHRQFVRLARRVQQAGFPAFRFDFTGMGDSPGEDAGFLRRSEDLSAAITFFLTQCPSLHSVVVFGLCDGASAALLYEADPRVAGLILVNPWVRSDATLARVHLRHYYAKRLVSPDFWRKVLTGQWRARRAAGDLSRTLAKGLASTPAHGDADFRVRMAEGWDIPGRKILLLLSENDFTAREFAELARTSAAWTDRLDRARVTRIDFPGADHTFSRGPDQEAMEAAVVSWLSEQFATPA